MQKRGFSCLAHALKSSREFALGSRSGASRSNRLRQPRRLFQRGRRATSDRRNCCRAGRFVAGRAGHARQEKWIARNLAHTGVKVALGVGSSIFIQGASRARHSGCANSAANGFIGYTRNRAACGGVTSLATSSFSGACVRARQQHRRQPIGGYQTEP